MLSLPSCLMGFLQSGCRAYHCSGFPCCGARALELLITGLVAPRQWDLQGPGIKPVSPALRGRFFTPGPPGGPDPGFLGVVARKRIVRCFFRVCLLLRFGSSAKVVHFLGSSKPWNYKYNPQTGSVLEEGSGRADQHQTSFLNQWWGIYHRRVLPLCENIRNKDHQGSPGHTVSILKPRS